MLNHIRIKNFKKFDDVNFELGKPVVLIGPNNSGKTTALQALALWDIGLRRWNEKRQGKTSPEKRPGVTLSRNDLISIPIPYAKSLWRDLHVRNISRTTEGKQKTENIRITIIVDGITKGKNWTFGLEFDYANEESFYCRPLLKLEDSLQERMSVPGEVFDIRIAFLPPMSGLASEEPKLEPGRINVLLGEGQTAQVLRNLCYQISDADDPKSKQYWSNITKHLDDFFGIDIQPPQYIKERGEITMTYKEPAGTILDISASGRGLQQTLLLLAYLYANPQSILLLDEPDAHLEILRQRQIYQLITEIAKQQGSQIIAASHSEIVLNEAADRDMVIAFVGKPHRIDDRGRQVLKSLKEIGFEQYYMAEQTGWVLYLEGATDLAILKAFAKTLNHPAVDFLERPFVHYVFNQPQKARDHFFGLREAKNDLQGIAIFDRLDKNLHSDSDLIEQMWTKRELENYLCLEEVLLKYAPLDTPDDLFGLEEVKRREQAMKEAIDEITDALKKLKKVDPWSSEIKASDDFLDPLFDNYFNKLGLPNLLQKNDYCILAELVPKEKIDPEIIDKLNLIVEVAKKAKPREN